jgi:ribosomal protein S15P/S13E
MSENETYRSQLVYDTPINAILATKIDNCIHTTQSHTNQIAALQERILNIEQHVNELRLILSGRQFIQRSVSFEDEDTHYHS